MSDQPNEPIMDDEPDDAVDAETDEENREEE